LPARRAVLSVAAALVAPILWPLAGRAFANVAVGEQVPNREFRTLDGRRATLLAKGAKANVFVFFRPEQEHSLDTLKAMAECERDFAGKPVNWVAIVSDSWAPEVVQATVQAAGIRMPVLWDEKDALYGQLGVRLHPVIGIVDAKGKLAAYEPFRQINYCDRVRAKIQFVLGEIDAAAVAAVENPARSVTRTDSGVARRHLNFARNLFRIQKHDKALEEVKKSLGVEPSAAAYALEGQILAAQGKCPEAVPLFDQALRMEPSNPEAATGKRGCTR
jgi:tetratricopeptide (TPR) repeat protein